MTSESLREAHDAALWKIHRVRTLNGNVNVVAVGDIMNTLNKIRAEIEAEKIEGFAARNGGLEIALQIIDKYRYAIRQKIEEQE